MATTKTDKPDPRPSGDTPAFSFGLADLENEPEVSLSFSSQGKPTVGGVVQGVDLTGVPRILLLAGRGKTGKTTNIRWMTEMALAAERPVLMGDIDPTNASFSTYFDGVHRPADADSPAVTLKWLEQFISYALEHRLTTVIDLGGGDTTLRRLVDELPDLPSAVQDAGSALAALSCWAAGG